MANLWNDDGISEPANLRGLQRFLCEAEMRLSPNWRSNNSLTNNLKTKQNRCSKKRSPNGKRKHPHMEPESINNQLTINSKSMWKNGRPRIDQNRLFVVQGPILCQTPEFDWCQDPREGVGGRGRGKGKKPFPEGLKPEDTPKPPQPRGLVGF